MSSRNNTDRLSQLLQRGDPAEDANSATPDPMRRAALLTRCSESLEQIPYAEGAKGRTRIPFAIGALALSASLLVLYFLVTKPRVSPQIPQVAVLALPVPTPPVSRNLPKPVGDGLEKPKTVPPLLATPGRDTKETIPNRIATRKHNKKRSPSLAMHRPPASRPRRTIPSHPKPETEPTPAPEPVVERVILIADATPSEPEPNKGSVSIILTEQTSAVVVARPADNGTRR